MLQRRFLFEPKPITLFDYIPTSHKFPLVATFQLIDSLDRKGLSYMLASSCGENGYWVVQPVMLLLAMIRIYEFWIRIATGEMD